ncbi:DUF2158 domain-containing protein [Siculibacillus lacustris]|uniref:DUF2158 domain-containing protein n=1 Tax=Siculibacillus lacustris TaxID=1549641 RepID=A0A4Q9VIG1_9HYPH|nr:DUF2158 domain-containing protein [Siculibacillus lacustris]TBW34766.1 DUF2158 domain-containing protein [Siculibacillus lacustris]
MTDTTTDTIPATTFSPGDVVMVKSGGPAMTVTAIIADLATLVWFAEEEEVFRIEELPSVALIAVDFDEDDDDAEEPEAEEPEDD